VGNIFHQDRILTYEYPEMKKPIPEDYRAEHRLMRRPDETPRCTACMLCATACPADCIEIVAAEHPDPRVEKYPAVYNINLLRCVYCSLCVEACPCDAIRMDTSVHPRLWGYRREDFIESKATLMARSRVLEREGPSALLDDLLRNPSIVRDDTA
jgi:NADH-quinone oxidoreductase subunit I